MRTYRSLRRRNEFAHVQRRGRRSVSGHLVLLIAESGGGSRVGVTVSKAVGNAVVRNRLRRRIKALLDRRSIGGPPYRDYLFIARPGAGALAFPALAAEVGALLG